jgi:DNA-binding MarR family transcriptional regulator
MQHLRALGPLVLDHRFRRMMEALLRTAEEVYDARGLRFRPRWTSTYLLVQQEGSISVTEIAERISLTHPAVITILEEMEAARVVRSAPDRSDGRRRLVSLTAHGRSLAPELTRLWQTLGDAQAARFAEAGCADIVNVLDRVEDGLRARSLSAEVLEQMDAPSVATGDVR